MRFNDNHWNERDEKIISILTDFSINFWRLTEKQKQFFFKCKLVTIEKATTSFAKLLINKSNEVNKSKVYLILLEIFSEIMDLEVEKNLQNNYRCLTNFDVALEKKQATKGNLSFLLG